MSIIMSMNQGKRTFWQKDCGLRDAQGASILGGFQYFGNHCISDINKYNKINKYCQLKKEL